jgi:hypothetical protein
MSLTFDFTNIKNYKTTVWIPEPTEENPDAARMNPVTEALIFGTMSIGIGRFTETNIAEVAARFRIMEKLQGPMLTGKGGKDHYITDEEFIAHIGLFTNVSEETRSAWTRRMFVNKRTSITDQYRRHFERDRQKAQAAA